MCCSINFHLQINTNSLLTSVILECLMNTRNITDDKQNMQLLNHIVQHAYMHTIWKAGGGDAASKASVVDVVSSRILPVSFIASCNLHTRHQYNQSMYQIFNDDWLETNLPVIWTHALTMLINVFRPVYTYNNRTWLLNRISANTSRGLHTQWDRTWQWCWRRCQWWRHGDGEEQRHDAPSPASRTHQSLLPHPSHPRFSPAAVLAGIPLPYKHTHCHSNLTRYRWQYD